MTNQGILSSVKLLISQDNKPKKFRKWKHVWKIDDATLLHSIDELKTTKVTKKDINKGRDKYREEYINKFGYFIPDSSDDLGKMHPMAVERIFQFTRCKTLCRLCAYHLKLGRLEWVPVKRERCFGCVILTTSESEEKKYGSHQLAVNMKMAQYLKYKARKMKNNVEFEYRQF